MEYFWRLLGSANIFAKEEIGDISEMQHHIVTDSA